MSMKTVYIVFTAGQRIGFEGGGNYFHLLETTGNVDVELTRDGGVVASANSVGYGFKVKPRDGFNGLSILSASAQTIKIAVGDGDGEFNQVTGTVSISGNTGAHTGSQATVTNVDNTVVAANAARKYLFVQNNDTAAVMRIMTDGTAATATKGIRVQPGGWYEPLTYVPTGAIHCFMETAGSGANNVDIVVG